MGWDIRHTLGAECEGLLDIGGRRLAHGICNRAISHPVITAADLGRGPLHLHLLFLGERKERDRLLARGHDQILGNAMSGDDEKPDLCQCNVDPA
jgi:hypothetical protein